MCTIQTCTLATDQTDLPDFRVWNVRYSHMNTGNTIGQIVHHSMRKAVWSWATMNNGNCYNLAHIFKVMLFKCQHVMCWHARITWPFNQTVVGRNLLQQQPEEFSTGTTSIHTCLPNECDSNRFGNINTPLECCECIIENVPPSHSDAQDVITICSQFLGTMST